VGLAVDHSWAATATPKVTVLDWGEVGGAGCFLNGRRVGGKLGEGRRTVAGRLNGSGCRVLCFERVLKQTLTPRRRLSCGAWMTGGHCVCTARGEFSPLQQWTGHDYCRPFAARIPPLFILDISGPQAPFVQVKQEEGDVPGLDPAFATAGR
jgi:hypothetical protein